MPESSVLLELLNTLISVFKKDTKDRVIKLTSDVYTKLSLIKTDTVTGEKCTEGKQ